MLHTFIKKRPLAGEIDDKLGANDSDPLAAGVWRWHHNSPPDLLEIQAPYARFFRL